MSILSRDADQERRTDVFEARKAVQPEVQVLGGPGGGEAGDRSDAEVARAYGVHPATVSRWKKEFMENGPEVFGGQEEIQEYEEKISRLERTLGQKEVEIALLKNFLDET